MVCSFGRLLLGNDTIVILICTIANCGIEVNVAFRFASPVQCQVNELGDSVSDHHYFSLGSLLAQMELMRRKFQGGFS